jgi:hypothetical protein
MFLEELHANLFYILFGLFTIVGLSGGLYIQFGRNGPVKRNLIPWVQVASVALFVSSFAVLHPLLPLFVLPPCILIAIINIAQTKVCDVCGKTNFKRDRCGKCGRKL